MKLPVNSCEIVEKKLLRAEKDKLYEYNHGYYYLIKTQPVVISSHHTWEQPQPQPSTCTNMLQRNIWSIFLNNKKTTVKFF